MNERYEQLKLMAEKSWFVFHNERDYAHENAMLLDQLDRFAKQVEAVAIEREREACAKLCDEASSYFEYDRASPEYSAEYCAKEIRSRK
jgi:hypothetical protein